MAMKMDFIIKLASIAAAAFLLVFAVYSAAQDKPADNMQIVREKIKADKKLLVAANMDLTESEATAFWPVYDQYQKDLQKINQRIVKVIEGYAEDYRNRSLSDDKADRKSTRLNSSHV